MNNDSKKDMINLGCACFLRINQIFRRRELNYIAIIALKDLFAFAAFNGFCRRMGSKFCSLQLFGQRYTNPSIVCYEFMKSVNQYD